MKALTTVNDDELTISFPEIRAVLKRLIQNHLRHRLEKDREKYWKEDKAFKIRGECLQKIEQISDEMLRNTSPAVSVDFQRTLRIPDDGNDHFLPPGLGAFPLRHVQDFAGSFRLPEKWNERGGVMLPIHQSEALWLSFNSEYPMALKIGTGKICAVSGDDWSDGLTSEPQNYCALPDQPWLDGYCVEKGVIRQFVAAPLNEGFTVEEQLTGKGDWGGIQLEAWPLDPKIYWKEELQRRVDAEWEQWLRGEDLRVVCSESRVMSMCCESAPEMGLAAGGRMQQEIYEDDRNPSDYIACDGNRCFVHLCNAEQWELITGEAPPNTPPSSKDYSDHGFPWFDYYDEKQTALTETTKLGGIKSIKQLETELDKKILPTTPDEAKPKVIVKYIKE